MRKDEMSLCIWPMHVQHADVFCTRYCMSSAI